MSDRYLDVALRIKTDLGDGVQKVDAINNKVLETGKSADKAKVGLGRLSQQLDALVANTSQTVQLLQGMDARMADLTQRSVQVAQATAQVEAGARAAAEGIKAVGESESDAAARIREVIAASREQAATEQAVTAAAKDADAAAQQRATTAQDTAAILQRQNAQMRQSSTAAAEMAASERQATASTEDQAAALTRLLSQIDPTIAALERLDQQEAELQRFRQAGLIDDESFERFRTQVESGRSALGRMGVSAGQTAQAMRQLPAQITDVTVSLAAGMPVWLVFLQQGSQIKDSFGGVKPALEGILSVLTPFRIAIGATVGVIGLLGAAAIAGYRQEEQLSNSIIRTGNYAGTTSGQIEQLAESFGAVNGRTGEARDILNGLVGTGKVAGDALASVGRAAVNMAALSGKSAQEVVQEFSRMADDPVRAAIELDNQYHFLNTTLFQQIQTLQQAGNQYEALKLIAGAFADDTGHKMDELHQHMSWLENFAENFKNKNGFTRIWDWAKDAGRPDDAISKFQEALQAYNYYNEQYKKFAAIDPGSDTTATYLAAAKEAYATLQQAQKTAQKAQSDAAAEGVAKQVQADGKAAAQSIDRLTTSLDRAKQRQDALNKAASDLYKIHLAGGKLPEGVNFNGPQADMPQGPGWDKLVAQINQRYATRTPKQADNQAATDRAAATAQQALIDSLAQLQGELDPVAAAWVKYNQAVAQADKQAATAKQARGANVEAIDAERNAVVQLAAKQRDAALDKLTDKDRQAWERLREALRTPTEVRAENAQAQIKQLNDLLTKGVISAQQYHDSIQRAADKSVLPAPTYSGLDAAVGGPYSEIQKNQQAQQALDTWHQQQLAANEAFRATDAANEEAYQARKAAIEQQYATQSQQIEQARQRLLLTSASDFFGSLAALQSSHNSKLARVGKAAAIAQALMQTYLSAETAYAQGGPYLGPALAAVAVVAGLANVAQIRAQPTSFATGGAIRGPGTGTSDSVPIWASNGEFMQREAAVKYYGLDFMHAVNSLQYPKMAYAEGGLVGVPAPQVRAAPRAHLPAPSTTGGANAAPRVGVRIVNQVDPQFVTDQLQSSANEEVIINMIGRNATRVKQSLGG